MSVCLLESGQNMESFQMDGGQAQDFVLCLQLPDSPTLTSATPPEAACQCHPDAIHTTGSSHLPATTVLSLQMRRLATSHRHARD